MFKNIVLIGFMGAGKSLISRRLAQMTDREILSIDRLIEEKEGRKISDIFRDSGEPYFRKLEKEAVAEVSRKQAVIIDCGGGVVLDRENLVMLKEHGIVFYLSATAEEIHRRVKDEHHRPLLQTEDPRASIEQLLAKRRSFYEQADHIIDTNERPPDDIGQEILAILTAAEKE